MKRAALLAAAVLLASACRSRREAPPAEPMSMKEGLSYGQAIADYKTPPAKAEETAPKEGTWSAQMEEAVGRLAYAMPSPPVAYAYHAGSDPRLLADNVGYAAKFIAYSLRYQEAAAKIPSRFWTDADKAALEQNKVLLEQARRILKDDAERLTR